MQFVRQMEVIQQVQVQEVVIPQVRQVQVVVQNPQTWTGRIEYVPVKPPIEIEPVLFLPAPVADVSQGPLHEKINVVEFWNLQIIPFYNNYIKMLYNYVKLLLK